MGHFPVQGSTLYPMFGPATSNTLWEHLILVIPTFLLKRQRINKFSPVPSTHSIPIMRYATETHMALFNLELDPKNFDQMIQDRNARTVTHFITRAAMCATVNSLSTPALLSSLWFDQSKSADYPKRVLFVGFVYAYFCNVSVFTNCYLTRSTNRRNILLIT